MQPVLYIVFAVFAMAALIFVVVFGRIGMLWIQCQMSRADVTIFHILGMMLRRSPAKHLCQVKIMSVQAGFSIPLHQIERAHVAGADVELMVRAMIKSRNLGQDLTWEQALQNALKNQYDDYVEENYES